MSDHLRDRLSCAEILTLAERESGAFGLIDDGLRARVSAMVEWVNEGAPYAPAQVWAIRDQIKHLLVTRLKLALDRQRYPAIAEERVEQPIFIIGMARSGTTMLHSLLAEDPDVLKPLSWHMFSPSPPPGAGPMAAERISYADRMMEAWMDFSPAHKIMHPYVDKKAYQTIEDEELFSLDFRNAYPLYYYRVPILEPAHVGLRGEQADAFRFHRTMLQHLQWNSGKTRWVCKGPTSHMHLDALLEVYPDALCVWPHRPLGETYASNIAFRAVTFDAIQGRPNDWSSQAKEGAERMKQAIDRLLANKMIDDPRILHLSFRDIAADPVGAIRTVYERRGLPVSAEFEGRVNAWLDDPENAADRFGRYPYSYEAFGLDRDWVEELFADYSKRFGLA